jgi:hypothetical protein
MAGTPYRDWETEASPEDWERAVDSMATEEREHFLEDVEEFMAELATHRGFGRIVRSRLHPDREDC